MSQQKTNWDGIWTALVTPFKKDGSIDWDSYRQLLKRQVRGGVTGVIPCGTTGESPTLNSDEKRSLILFTVKELRNTSTRVIAGTGSNDTRETVEFSLWASAQGVDGLLIVTPYYNKPSQSGLTAHYLTVANAVTCPIMLYNVPGRAGVSLSASTISRLAKHPRIVAVKEASGNPMFTSEILNLTRHHRPNFKVFSGDDGTFLSLLAVGARGNVSVASNLIPKEMVKLQKSFDRGDHLRALALHSRFTPLFRDLFIESNPVPVKHALYKMKICSETVRLPLVTLSESNRRTLSQTLKECRI